jgi:hypothetical protein
MKIVNYFLNRVQNVGDRSSAPTLYVDIPNAELIAADIDGEMNGDAQGIILGGGAILPRLIERNLQFSAPAVIWGAGYTLRGATHFVPFDLPRNTFDLIGVRDYGTVYEWVPCASCLSPLFDQKYEIAREFVLFENRQHAPLPFCHMSNDHLDFAEVISTLASAETVVTSSYHGAYWGTLLGRRVLAAPFSSKFYGLRHPPRMIDTVDWRNLRGHCWPEALEECRAANRSFASRVLNLFLR